MLIIALGIPLVVLIYFVCCFCFFLGDFSSVHDIMGNYVSNVGMYNVPPDDDEQLRYVRRASLICIPSNK